MRARKGDRRPRYGPPIAGRVGGCVPVPPDLGQDESREQRDSCVRASEEGTWRPGGTWRQSPGGAGRGAHGAKARVRWRGDETRVNVDKL